MQEEKCPDSIRVAARQSNSPTLSCLILHITGLLLTRVGALPPRNCGVLSEQHYSYAGTAFVIEDRGPKETTMEHGHHVKIIGRDEFMYS
jgi:hypothetical protein